MIKFFFFKSTNYVLIDFQIINNILLIDWSTINLCRAPWCKMHSSTLSEIKKMFQFSHVKINFIITIKRSSNQEYVNYFIGSIHRTKISIFTGVHLSTGSKSIFKNHLLNHCPYNIKIFYCRLESYNLCIQAFKCDWILKCC